MDDSFYNLLFIFVTVVVMGTILGLFIVKTINDRMSNININLPEQRIEVNWPPSQPLQPSPTVTEVPTAPTATATATTEPTIISETSPVKMHIENELTGGGNDHRPFPPSVSFSRRQQDEYLDYFNDHNDDVGIIINSTTDLIKSPLQQQKHPQEQQWYQQMEKSGQRQNQQEHQWYQQMEKSGQQQQMEKSGQQQQMEKSGQQQQMEKSGHEQSSDDNLMLLTPSSPSLVQPQQHYISPDEMTVKQRVKFMLASKFKKMQPIDYKNWLLCYKNFPDDLNDDYHIKMLKKVQSGIMLTHDDIPTYLTN